MKMDIESLCGLPIELDADACELIFKKGMNTPSYYARTAQDLEPVWANPETGEDKVLYRVSSGLWLDGQESIWKDANIVYGLVLFAPGSVNREYFKSSGQYHPLCQGLTQATPEIYTVLVGEGHFMLQKATPPYENVQDPICVKVRAGETFVVPPDYGHLQINPEDGPLLFSYVVMDGLKGVYQPYRDKKGAMYYEMAEQQPFVFNKNYKEQLPLRIVNASDICQVPELNKEVTYQKVLANLPDIKYITNPALFSESAAL